MLALGAPFGEPVLVEIERHARAVGELEEIAKT